MPRTTESQIREIINTALASGQVNAFLSDASLWVTEELASSTQFAFSTSRLELIERYLACALIRLRDLGLSSSTLDDISESYQVDPEVTDYLKRAAAFDPTGKIQAVFMPKEDRKQIRFKVGEGFIEDDLKRFI